MIRKILNWFMTPPNENDLFGVNVRTTIQAIMKAFKHE